MLFLRHILRNKGSKKQQIGLAENKSTYCLVYFEQEKPIIIWQSKPFEVKSLLQQAVKNSENFTIIRSVPYHYIWRKTIILPQDSARSSQHQQILQTIKQELPISPEEIYFDTLQQPLLEQNLIKIQIFALKKSYADPLILNDDTILDCELHCYLRGLRYENSESEIHKFSLRNKYFEFKSNGLAISDVNSSSISSEQAKHELFLIALGAALWGT